MSERVLSQSNDVILTQLDSALGVPAWLYPVLSGYAHGREWAMLHGATASDLDGFDTGMSVIRADWQLLCSLAERTVAVVERVVTLHVDYRIVGGRGRQVAKITAVHTATGLRDLIGFLGRHGVGEVAIERPDGPVIGTLLGADLTVVVISPNQVKNLPRPLRLGREQGRPVRRVRARRHAAH